MFFFEECGGFNLFSMRCWCMCGFYVFVDFVYFWVVMYVNFIEGWKVGGVGYFVDRLECKIRK